MFNQAAETNRTILAAVLAASSGHNEEGSSWEALRALREFQPNPLEWIRAVKEMLPPPAPASTGAQPSLSDQLSAVKTLLDFTRPSVAAPEPSPWTEIASLFGSVIQSDTAAKAVAKAAEPTERRPSPPMASSRLRHVPGVGVVQVLQPEPPLPIPRPAHATSHAAAPAVIPPTTASQARPPVGSAYPSRALEPRAPAAAATASSPTPDMIDDERDARAPRYPQAAFPNAVPERERSPMGSPPPPPPRSVTSEMVINLEALRRDPVALGQLLEAIGFDARAAVTPKTVTEPLTAARPQVVPAKVVKRSGSETPDLSSGVSETLGAPRPPSSPENVRGSAARESAPHDGGQIARDVHRPDAVGRGREAPVPPKRSTTTSLRAPDVTTPAEPGTASEKPAVPPQAEPVPGPMVPPPHASDAAALGSRLDAPSEPPALLSVEERAFSGPFPSTSFVASNDVDRATSESAQSEAPDVPRTSPRVIALPAQMPPFPPDDSSPEDRESLLISGAEVPWAEGEQAVSGQAGDPRDELVRMLKDIPGLGSRAEEFVTALANLPADEFASLADQLPPEFVRALGKSGRGG